MLRTVSLDLFKALWSVRIHRAPSMWGANLFFLLRHTYIVCKLFHCSTVSSLSVNSYAEVTPPPYSPNLFLRLSHKCTEGAPLDPFCPPFYLPARPFGHDP